MTKPVALADSTYQRLKLRKRPGESFSQTIERLLKVDKKDPRSFARSVPKSRIAAKKRLEDIQSDRDAAWEDA